MNKITISVVSVLVAAAIVGGYFFPLSQTVTRIVGSPVGSTFGDAKLAAINISPSTGATSTSILNTDGSDRYITTFEGACSNVGTSLTPLTGAGLASLTLTAATTSTATPAVNPNSNSAFVATVATSSTIYIQASSTQQLSGTPVNDVWKAGSYLSFYFNATNTAACTVGVRYLGS